MTDAEFAAVLRRILHDRPGLVTRERAAIERSIELLEREAERVSLLNAADGLLGLVLYRGEGKGDTKWEADARDLIVQIRQTLRTSQ